MTGTFLGLRDVDINKIGPKPVSLEPAFQSLSRSTLQSYRHRTRTVSEMLPLRTPTDAAACVFTMVIS